jgi:hypothetical protein
MNIFYNILFLFSIIIFFNFNWGLGIGDWGLGIGDWGLGPIPKPPTPIPQTPKIWVKK